jgi:drug/metabolite transporter (DMT)-like permease
MAHRMAAPRPLPAMGLVVLFGLIWAATEFIAGASGVPVEQVVFTRYATHLLTLLLLFGPRHKSALVHTRRPFLQFVRSMLMLGMPLSYLMAALRMPISDTLAVFWFVPLAVLGFSEAGRRLWRWPAGCAAYAGAFLVTGAGAGVLTPASIFALTMGCCFAMYVVLTKYLSCDGTLTNLFHSALWVFLALSVRMYFVWKWPTKQGWAALALVGVAGLIALYVLDLAVRFDGPGAFIPALYLQPVFIRLFEAGLAGFGRRAAAGAGIVLCTTTLAAICSSGHYRRGPSQGSRARAPA